MIRLTSVVAVLSLAVGVAAAPPSQPYVWKNVAIYGGGFVTGIITHPKEPGLIYCRTDIGGAYRWDAKAGQWIPLNDWVGSKEGNLLGIESVAIDPRDPEKLYIAAGTYSQSKDVTSILRSSDRGKTFQRCDVKIPMGGNDGGRPVGERLAVDPNDGNVLYFGSRDAGLWTSADGAAKWKKVDRFPAIATDKSTRMTAGGWGWAVGISFVQFAGKDIYVGVCTRETSLYRSADGGKTWSAVPNQPVGLRPNHVALASDGHLLISYADEPGPHEMHDGAIWKLDTNDDRWTNITPVKPAGQDNFGYSGISVLLSDPNVMVACTFCRWTKKDQIFRSIDGGKSWKGLLHTEPDSTPLAIFDHTIAPYSRQSAPHWLGDVEIDPFDANRILFVTGYGIWVSHDASNADKDQPTHWFFEDKGIEEIACLDLISPPTGAHLVSFIGDVDGFRHDDLDTPPARGRHSPTMGTCVAGDFAQNQPDLMARVGPGKPFGEISNDGGATWKEFASIPSGARAGTIAIAADGQSIVWSSAGGSRRNRESAGGAYVSRDQGTTWTACENLPAGASVVADRVDPKTVYGIVRGSGDLYVSSDGGGKFATVPAKLPDSEHRKLRAAPTSKGDLWLCADDHGLFHAVSSGDGHFEKIPGVASALAVGFGKAAQNASYPAIYLVGTMAGTDGVFRSDDQAKSWVRINDDQHQYAWIGQCVIGDPRVYGRVYLATNGRGILYADPAAAASDNVAVPAAERSDGTK